MMRAIRSTLALVAMLATVLVATLQPAAAARESADDVAWGRLDIWDYAPHDGPGGTWELHYRDTARDGKCVRAALVDEDGTVLARGPRSCGRWVTWSPEGPSDDWPAPILIRSDGARSTPWAARPEVSADPFLLASWGLPDCDPEPDNLPCRITSQRLTILPDGHGDRIVHRF